MGRIKYPNEYIDNEDFTMLRITSEKYGVFDYNIDNENVEKCKEKHWGITACKSNNGDYIGYYAHSGGLMLHRFLMGNPKGMIVDHIDGDTFNARSYNLRICTQKENGKNRKENKNNQSGVKGVMWNIHAPTPKWQAYIMVNYHHKSLGYYENFEDAVKARKEAEEKYFGEYNRGVESILIE